MTNLWSFTPLDSCFFREAKPFNAGEGGFLGSQFPPPSQTMTGSFRNTIGEWRGVDWKKYKDDQNDSLHKIIGTPDNPSPLSFSGPYVLKGQQRLYPAPLHLICRYDAKQKKHEWERLRPGAEVNCDIGKDVSLPEVSGKFEGGKLPEKVWLDQTDFTAVLCGAKPRGGIAESELVKEEPRAGIGRNNKQSTVSEGLLYFVRHLRLFDNVAFAIVVDGFPLDVQVPEEILTRLGGEGRMAALRFLKDAIILPEAPAASGEEKGLIITLLTHGDLSGKSEPDWAKLNSDFKVTLRLESACIGKPVREGGWDYAERKPKPLKSLVPAGSSYFVTVTGDLNEAIKALHGKKIGSRTEFGYGEIVVGLWK